MKILKGILVVFLAMYVSFSYASTDSTLVDSLTTTLESNEVIKEVIETLEDDTRGFIEMLLNGEFPPSNRADWIRFLTAVLLPFLARVWTQRVKYSEIFAKVKANGGTPAILTWVSIALGGIYEAIVSGIQFDFTDWGGYAMLTYGFAIAIHEVLRSLRGKDKVVEAE